jgi:hypothetical protein
MPDKARGSCLTVGASDADDFQISGGKTVVKTTYKDNSGMIDILEIL